MAQQPNKKHLNKLSEFSVGHQTNLALAQYYRWFQTFEREQNDQRIKNHLSLLSDSVLITTYNGPMHGKEGMLGFLKYVSTWKNSHHIERVSVKPSNDGTIELEADILYKNILPDKKQNTYKLNYITELKEINNELPVFNSISLLPTATIENPTYEDAYTENRSKSFMHYWFYLLDNPSGNANKFRELLAPDFHLQQSEANISNYEQFESWLRKKHSNCRASLHSYKNFKSKTNADQTISVSLDVVWKGINLKGEKITAEIHHEWILESKLDKRFARIKDIKSQQIRPFTVVQNF